MKGRRVVITGMGMLTPLGDNVTDTWTNILKGKSGVSKNEKFDTTSFRSKIIATINNFDVSKYLSSKKIRQTDIFIQYAIFAAVEALNDSGLDISEKGSKRIGVAIGSGIGGFPYLSKSQDILREYGPRKVSPFFIPGIISNMASGVVSIEFNLKGPNICLVSACATGLHNIGEGARIIAYGDAEVMVCGGTEMSTAPLGLAGFCAMNALSSKFNETPKKASRPWDKDRDGFVMGDGAGILILEELEHAKKRGAKIYAEVSGYGRSADAYHIAIPHVSGGISSMKEALIDARIDINEIDYINAHATSTPVGDLNEVLAIKKVFGKHAYKLSVSSTKSMTGHLLGASGAIEAIFSILAMRDQIAPPTINLDNPDDDCDLDFVPHQPKEMKINKVLCNSFGFGGTNASIVFNDFID